MHPYHAEEIELNLNYKADQELMLRAEHWDYYPGDGEYAPNPYAAELDRRAGIYSDKDLEYMAIWSIHQEEAERRYAAGRR